jgi:hypothetical protein
MARKRSRGQSKRHAVTPSHVDPEHENSITVVASRKQVRDWILKGTVSGLLGILVTIGIQQVGTIRERQQIARILLVEAQQNAATLATFWSTEGLPELTDERRRYEQTLVEQRVLPFETVLLLHRTYEASAKAVNSVQQGNCFRLRLRSTALQMGRIDEPSPPLRSPLKLPPGCEEQMAVEHASLATTPPAESRSSTPREAPANKMTFEDMMEQGKRLTELLSDFHLRDARKVDWNPLVSRLREEGGERWWLNWLE